MPYEPTPANAAIWTMSKRVKVNVGTLDEMGQRFVNAWHRIERGEKEGI